MSVENTNKSQQAKSYAILHQLQQLSLIPKIQPIILKTTHFQYDNQSFDTSYQSQQQSRKLLLSKNHTIAYTLISASGKPTDTNAIVIFPDGAFYKGSVQQGLQQGFGKLENKQLFYSYQGSWKQGVPEGTGLQIISTNTYEGSFKKGKKNGKGTLRFDDGTVFQGLFKENQINGFGKMTFQHYSWKGFWRNGYLQGQGTQTIREKRSLALGQLQSQGKNYKGKQSVYSGCFNHGQRQGFGKFKWDQNREYQGNFKRGQLHGQGILKIGIKLFRGIWEQGNDIQIKQVHVGSNSKIQLKRCNKIQNK